MKILNLIALSILLLGASAFAKNQAHELTKDQNTLIDQIPIKNTKKLKWGLTETEIEKILGKPAHIENSKELKLFYYSFDGGKYDSTFAFKNSQLTSVIFMPEKTKILASDLVRVIPAPEITAARKIAYENPDHKTGQYFWYENQKIGVRAKFSDSKEFPLSKIEFWNPKGGRP